MVETHLTFRTIDFIDTTLDGIEKLAPNRYMYAHLDLLNAFNELLAVRASGEAARLRRRIDRIRDEVAEALL